MKLGRFIRDVLVVLALLFIFCGNAKAGMSMIKVTNMYLEIESATGPNRAHFDLKDEKIDGYMALGYRASVGKYMYTKSKIRSMFSSSQFREVALDMEVGFTFKGLDIYATHTSEHTLDSKGYDDYPEKNAVGLRFNLIGG